MAFNKCQPPEMMPANHEKSHSDRGKGAAAVRSLACTAVILLLLSALGCYQPKQGCQDLRAIDYDVTVDEPCTTGVCCTYPSLTVTLLHRADIPGVLKEGFVFRYDSLYPSPFDTSHLFSFQRCRFIIRDLRLVADNGNEVPASDSIELQTATGVLFTERNSFLKVERDIFQPAKAGTYLGAGRFTHLRFRFGLSPNLQQADPAILPKGHALKDDTLLYRGGEGFAALRLQLKRDSLSGTVPLDIWSVLEREIELPLPEVFVLDYGFNLRMSLEVNYLAFFEGVDLASDSEAEIVEKIEANISKAFAVTSISME